MQPLNPCELEIDLFCKGFRIDLYIVSKLLGHKDITTTQIYAKIIDQKKIDAVSKLPML